MSQGLTLPQELNHDVVDLLNRKDLDPRAVVFEPIPPVVCNGENGVVKKIKTVENGYDASIEELAAFICAAEMAKAAGATEFPDRSRKLEKPQMDRKRKSVQIIQRPKKLTTPKVSMMLESYIAILMLVLLAAC